MLRCAILGGNGFLGRHVTRAVRAAGFDVRVFDKAAVPEVDGIEQIVGNYYNRADLIRAIEGCDYVVHLIWSTVPKTANDNVLSDLSVNVGAFIQMLDVLKEHKPKKVVFCSSGGTVYGLPIRIPIDESHPTNPICAYGVSKLCAEKYLSFYGYLGALNYCILRVANPFGEWQSPNAGLGFVATVMSKVLSGEQIEIWGDGTTVRDFVYAGDVAEAFARALSHRGSDTTFNVGAGEGKTLLQVVREIEEITSKRARVSMVSRRGFDVPVNVLDIKRAELELGWKPAVSFRQALYKTLEWQTTAAQVTERSHRGTAE